MQVNIRWKTLDEIYKIYMLLHRSDLNISPTFRQLFGVLNIRNVFEKIAILFANLVAIFADFYKNCSDFVENAERCNFSKFLDFNLIFIMIIPEIYLISTDFSI